jgi:hypothetical protein
LEEIWWHPAPNEEIIMAQIIPSPSDWLTAIATAVLVIANLYFVTWTLRENRRRRYPAPEFVRGHIKRDTGNEGLRYKMQLVVANPGDSPILLTMVLLLMSVEGENLMILGDDLLVVSDLEGRYEGVVLIQPRSATVLQCHLQEYLVAQHLEPKDPGDGTLSIVWRRVDLGLRYNSGNRVHLKRLPLKFQWMSDKESGTLLVPGEDIFIAPPPFWLTKLPFSIVYVPMLRLWALLFIWRLGRKIPEDKQD